jgi:selenide,water dikinase
MSKIQLTQFSKASGCGCKIAPAQLEEILSGCAAFPTFAHLLVGNDTKDDAAVYELADGSCVVSTTDFFMPIVDDAFDFGSISAANAISDIYAMGAKPLMAIAILGWPVETLPTALAQEVMKGAQQICANAGIPLAGGHSVDAQEPFFGLAVTGILPNAASIKRNNTVQLGDVLYITKPLGIGMFSAAHKRGLLSTEDYTLLQQHCTTLNAIGQDLGALPYVHAMTDITGFGFTGHLLEMLDAQHFAAIIHKEAIPILPAAHQFAKQFVFPNNTTRNYNAHLPFIEGMTGLDFLIYCDPQTSGGLLFSVAPDQTTALESLLQSKQQFFAKIGTIEVQKDKKIIFQ